MLSEQDSELISKSLDGQLSAQQDKAFKQRLLQEPLLNQQYQQLKANDEKLKAAFASMDEKPLPAELDELLKAESPAKFNVRYLAVAASLLAVSFISYYGFEQTPNSNMHPALASALDTTPSMTPSNLDDDTQFIVNQTFLHRDGRLCREFLKQDKKSKTRGVACKKKNKWRKVVEETSILEGDQHYVTASDESQSQVSDFINQNLKGEPLSTSEEKAQLGY